MDSRFRMGSMGSVVGEKSVESLIIVLNIGYHLYYFLQVVVPECRRYYFINANGKNKCIIKRHSDAGLLYVSYLTHPTTGGVSASFASVGDINLSEPKALIGFAGRRVIEQTINEKLPEDFQTAEFY